MGDLGPHWTPSGFSTLSARLAVSGSGVFPFSPLHTTCWALAPPWGRRILVPLGPFGSVLSVGSFLRFYTPLFSGVGLLRHGGVMFPRYWGFFVTFGLRCDCAFLSLRDIVCFCEVSGVREGLRFFPHYWNICRLLVRLTSGPFWTRWSSSVLLVF